MVSWFFDQLLYLSSQLAANTAGACAKTNKDNAANISNFFMDLPLHCSTLKYERGVVNANGWPCQTLSNQGCYEDPIDLTASEVDDEKPQLTHSGNSVAELGQVFDKRVDAHQ